MHHPAGTLFFCHSPGIVGRAIRLGEGRRAQFNHVAIGVGDGTVIQAEGRGVTDNAPEPSLIPGRGGYVLAIEPPRCLDTDAVLRFARQEVGDKYGFVTIASIVVTLLTPKFLNVMLPNTWICSALAAEAWRAGGWVHRWPDSYQVKPEELHTALAEYAYAERKEG